MQLAYCSLNANSFQPQARFKPEIICIDGQISHLWGWKREMMPSLKKFVLCKFKAMGRSNQGTSTFPLGTQLFGGTGTAIIWEVICLTPHTSPLQQGENGRAGSHLNCYPPSLLCLTRHFIAVEPHLRPSLHGRQSLSLFSLPVHPWGWTKRTDHILSPQSDI